MSDKSEPISAEEAALLGELRVKIDDIDQQIGDLICARANCAVEVAHEIGRAHV